MWGKVELPFFLGSRQIWGSVVPRLCLRLSDVSDASHRPQSVCQSDIHTSPYTSPYTIPRLTLPVSQGITLFISRRVTTRAITFRSSSLWAGGHTRTSSPSVVISRYLSLSVIEILSVYCLLSVLVVDWLLTRSISTVVCSSIFQNSVILPWRHLHPQIKWTLAYLLLLLYHMSYFFVYFWLYLVYLIFLIALSIDWIYLFLSSYSVLVFIIFIMFMCSLTAPLLARVSVSSSRTPHSALLSGCLLHWVSTQSEMPPSAYWVSTILYPAFCFTHWIFSHFIFICIFLPFDNFIISVFLYLTDLLFVYSVYSFTHSFIIY